MESGYHITSFREFWPYYVSEHQCTGTRVLHFIGSSLGLICLLAAILTRRWWLVLVGLVAGYGFAWFSHFFIEHNRPATFRYPLWSFIADWRMWLLTLRGEMKEEVRRVMNIT